MAETWKIIGRGFNGWHAKSETVSGSGGDIEDRPWWAGGIQKGYLTEAAEGCTVYDAAHLETDPAASYAFVKWVVSGPIPDPSLPSGHVCRFNDPRTGVKYDGGKISGVDFVSVDLYMSIMKDRVPGVKTGTVKGGAIVWD